MVEYSGYAKNKINQLQQDKDDIVKVVELYADIILDIREVVDNAPGNIPRIIRAIIDETKGGE